MYNEFFGLRESPFNNTPDPRFFYSTPDHDEALASLIYGIQERKGFVLLTGEVGAGKTLVSRMMLRHFGGNISFANINHTLGSAGDLMESVCTEFELPLGPNSSSTQLVRALHDYLLSMFSQNRPVVLILDEAQNLPIAAFEQLRMIGNLEADDAKLLQIAIVGQPELQCIFQSPELRQLKQRLFRSFHLPALNRQSTEGYVRHRLSVAGSPTRDVFDTDAMEEVFRVSRGLPRLINSLCDNSMLSAYSADRKIIDGPFVRSVAGQMMMDAPRPSARSTAGVRRTDPAASRVISAPKPPPFLGTAAPYLPMSLTPSRAETPPSERIERAARRMVVSANAKPIRPPDDSLATTAVSAPATTAAGGTVAEAQIHQLESTFQQKEERLAELLRSISTVATLLRKFMAKAEGTLAATRSERLEAEAISERLGAQQRSATRLLERLTTLAESDMAARVESSSSFSRPSFARTEFPASDPFKMDAEPLGSTERLSQMLSQTRSSLDHLRNLVRSTRFEDGVRPTRPVGAGT